MTLACCSRPPRTNHALSALAGLLSSSCCLLQLGANALSIGCAGFNTVLGPARPAMRLLTAAWLLVLWTLTLRRRWPRHHAVFSTLLCAGLAFMPELLLAGGGPAFAPPTASTFDLRLTIDGMGCEACQWHVRSVLERTAGVASADVDFAAGVANLRVSDGWGFNLTRLTLVLREGGYDVVGTLRSPPEASVLPSVAEDEPGRLQPLPNARDEL